MHIYSTDATLYQLSALCCSTLEIKVSQTFACSIQKLQGFKREHVAKFFFTTDIFPLLAYLLQVLLILSAWGSRASKKYKSPIWGKALITPNSFKCSHSILETVEFREILWNWKIKRQMTLSTSMNSYSIRRKSLGHLHKIMQKYNLLGISILAP